MTWRDDIIESSRRKVKSQTCSCGAQVFIGPSDDCGAWTATVDAEPIRDTHREAVARCSGRFSYSMWNRSLYTRYPEELRSSVQGDVYLDHRCAS